MSGGDVSERPQYLGSDRLDDLARMLIELTSELWILKDRTLVLEHLLASNGILAPDAIDSYQPTGDLSQTLLAERKALLERVMGAVLPSDDRVAAALAR
jgi:hypothetical protein